MRRNSWNIENGSRSICDYVRSNAERILQAKYDRLLNAEHENLSNAKNNLPEPHRPSENSTSTVRVDQNARVSVIGNTHLSDNALSFLNLGPSLSIAQNVSGLTYRKLVGKLHKLRGMSRIRLRNENTQ